jgi:hypothetical protein
MCGTPCSDGVAAEHHYSTELVIVACRQTVLRLSPTLPAAVALRNTQPVSVEKSHTLFSNVFYGPVGNVAQNSGHINQTANMGLRHEDLAKLVAEMATHLNELSLDPASTRGPRRNLQR